MQANVGGGGSTSYEVARIWRDIQIGVWASDPKTRSLIAEPIAEQVGTTMQTFLALPDGTGLYHSYVDGPLDDDSQSSYSLYASNVIVEVEYGIMQVHTTSQVGVFENAISVSQVVAPTTVMVSATN